MRRAGACLLVVSMGGGLVLASGCTGGSGSFDGSNGSSSGGQGGVAVAGSGPGGTGGTGGGGAGTTTSTTAGGGQGGTAGSGGQGGSGACSGEGDPCTNCAAQQCADDYCACAEDADCAALSACVIPCTDDACQQACWAQHPDSISLFALAWDCAAIECPSECPGVEPLDPCQVCMFENCPDTMNTCLANADCWGLIQCMGACGGQSTCMQQCQQQFPGGLGDAMGVLQCIQGPCQSDCA